MIYLDSELYLLEVSIWYDYFPQDTGLNHPNEGLHFFKVRVQRIRHYKVDTIRSLMVDHQKVSINADEILTKRTSFCLFDDLGSILFADQMNEAFFLVSGQKISSQLCKLNFIHLFRTHDYLSLKILCQFHEYPMLS